MVFAIKNIGTDEIYLFRHTGHMNGTVQSGSRDDDWDEHGNNGEPADGWDELFKSGWSGTCKRAANFDLNSTVDAAEKALGMAAAIIAVL